MNLSTDQLKALDRGQAVPLKIDKRECVVVRRDVYERVKDLSYDDTEMDPAEAYPFVNEVMADDDANDPTLESYQDES
jgi:hypothetical protein